MTEEEDALDNVLRFADYAKRYWEKRGEVQPTPEALAIARKHVRPKAS